MDIVERFVDGQQTAKGDKFQEKGDHIRRAGDLNLKIVGVFGMQGIGMVNEVRPFPADRLEGSHKRANVPEN